MKLRTWNCLCTRLEGTYKAIEVSLDYVVVENLTSVWNVCKAGLFTALFVRCIEILTGFNKYSLFLFKY